jgi:hypothetical protein
MNFFLGLLGAGLGYIGVHFMTKPVLDLRATRTEIAKALVLYANVDAAIPDMPEGRMDERAIEGRQRYRDLASTLLAQATTVPFYRFWSLIKVLPTFQEIETAKANLIGLSNTSGRRKESLDNSRRQDKIQKALHLQ